MTVTKFLTEATLGKKVHFGLWFQSGEYSIREGKEWQNYEACGPTAATLREQTANRKWAWAVKPQS